MAKRNHIRTIHVDSMWNAYCTEILTKNPDWWVKGYVTAKVPNKAIYRKYLDGERLTVIEVISYTQFREIVTSFYAKAKEAIIEGEVLYLGNYLGMIYGKTVERDHTKKVLNMRAMLKLEPVLNPETGKMERPKVYFTDDYWSTVAWFKEKLRNVSVYRFTITKNLKSGKGFNQMFSRALIERPALRFKYIVQRNTKRKR